MCSFYGKPMYAHFTEYKWCLQNKNPGWNYEEPAVVQPPRSKHVDTNSNLTGLFRMRDIPEFILNSIIRKLIASKTFYCQDKSTSREFINKLQKRLDSFNSNHPFTPTI
jgi:hypothetical protein